MCCSPWGFSQMWILLPLNPESRDPQPWHTSHHLPLGSFKNAAAWAPSPEILTWVVWRCSVRCFKTPQGYWLVAQIEMYWPRSLCLSLLSGQSEWWASAPVLNTGAQPHMQKQNLHLSKSPRSALSVLKGRGLTWAWWQRAWKRPSFISEPLFSGPSIQQTSKTS